MDLRSLLREAVRNAGPQMAENVVSELMLLIYDIVLHAPTQQLKTELLDLQYNLYSSGKIEIVKTLDGGGDIEPRSNTKH